MCTYHTIMKTDACCIFGDTQISKSTLLMGSCQVAFLSSLTVQSYARQFNILTNWTTALDMHSGLKTSLIADWSVENMNHAMTLSEMLLYFSVLP